MNKKLCIYHNNCNDGFAAATIVGMHFGRNMVEFYAANHGELPPDVTGREVIIVDFSYKRDILLKMADKAKSIIILDHHKTAEEELINLPGNVSVVFEMGKCGAVIAWDYYMSPKLIPKLIEYVQDRDLWTRKMEFTDEVSNALFSYPKKFDVWENLILNEDVQYLCDIGIILLAKHNKDIDDFIETAAYRDIIAGYDVPVLNAPYMWASDACHKMYDGEEFAATYWDMEGQRVYNLRSSEDAADVSKIAKLFGGGGHKHAAGFKVPFGQLSSVPLKNILIDAADKIIKDTNNNGII